LLVPRSFDANVIGARQAGPFLAGRLAGDAINVALIETKFIGGTGVDTAYTPTKTLVASASAHAAETAGLRKGSDRN